MRDTDWQVDAMGKKFAQQQTIITREFFNAGLQMGRQQIIDMLCLVLHDPNVMGKDTFGHKRLDKVVRGIGEKMDYFYRAWQKVDDADYWQAKLDAYLADCFGVAGLEGTFHQRYEFSPEYDYKNARWKK